MILLNVGMKNREDREKEYFSNDFNPTTNVFMEEEENFEELYDKVMKQLIVLN